MNILFCIFAMIILGASLFAVFEKNLFRSVMALTIFLSTLSGMYILLNADFIAVVQILLYVGGILVIISFVIMLISEQGNVKVFFNFGKYILFALLFFVVALFSLSIFQFSFPSKVVVEYGSNITQLARWLFTDALIPFEVISIILLVTLLGAVFFTLDYAMSCTRTRSRTRTSSSQVSREKEGQI